MGTLKTIRRAAMALALAVNSAPAGAATVGATYGLTFAAEPGAHFGPDLDPNFEISSVLSGSVTQVGVDSARFDLHFGAGIFTFAGLFLADDTAVDAWSGGRLVQDGTNVRNVFGDTNIPRGISFASTGRAFLDGDILSVTLSRDGLDVSDWGSFLHIGSISGLIGGVSYVNADGGVSVFGISGHGTAPVTLAAVPLPAGGVLLFAGIGALALLRRRGM